MHNRISIVFLTSLLVAGACADVEPDDQATALEPDERGIAHYSKHDDVAVPDHWHALLDSATIEEMEGGFMIAGYDANANVIGQILVQEAGPNIVEINHIYPRRCEQEYPDGPECADTLHVTVHISEQWNDAWSNAPAALFSDRATALAAKLPPDTEEGRLFCALSVASASVACASIALTGPLGAPGCALGALVSLCKCDTFHKAFPKVDWDKLCN